VKFFRTLYSLERVFPPKGDYSPPQVLHDNVHGTFELFDRLLTAGARLNSERLATALPVGASTNNFVEPPAGCIQLPIGLIVHNPDAAVRVLELVYVNSASTPDVWGRFNSVGGNELVVDRISVGATLQSQMRAAPVPRGNQLQIKYAGMTGGNTSICSYVFLEVPGELVTMMQLLTRPFGQHVYNTPV
jgi:hypothetical protein